MMILPGLLQVFVIIETVTAFAPTISRVAVNQRASFPSLAEKSYLDDGQLEDASLKEPETRAEDLVNGSEGDSQSNEPSESLSIEYVKDETEPSTMDEGEDTTGAHDAPNESNDDAVATLLRIAASTGRGEFAELHQKDEAAQIIAELELRNPTTEPTRNEMIYGRWQLVYCSTNLFRSSPFFMAGRAVCTTNEQAEQYDWFCDMHRKALAISNIGSVRQIISPTSMVSEFEVKAGAVPFLNDFTPLTYSGGLPFTIDGSIVSSADITPTDDGRSWEVFMDTVSIRGSNVPGLRTILDNGLQLQSRILGSFLEQNLEGYTNPRPIFQTTFLNESIRISRDQDGKVFVYAKESNDSTPTDYGKVEADLGALKLLGDFNDKITKFYL